MRMSAASIPLDPQGAGEYQRETDLVVVVVVVVVAVVVVVVVVVVS